MIVHAMLSLSRRAGAFLSLLRGLSMGLSVFSVLPPPAVRCLPFLYLSCLVTFPSPDNAHNSKPHFFFLLRKRPTQNATLEWRFGVRLSLLVALSDGVDKSAFAASPLAAPALLVPRS